MLPTLTVEGAAGDGAALSAFGGGFLVRRRSVTYIHKTQLGTNGAAQLRNFRLLVPLEQKNKNQSDHSCYTQTLLSTANLIGQFGLRFSHSWNKQSGSDCITCDGWSHGNHMTAWLPTFVG